MNKEKNVFLVIIVILIFNMISKVLFNTENMTDHTSCEITENSNCNSETEKQRYDNLMGKQPGQDKTNWELIFEHANGNRNAAGPMFYHWIINNMNPIALLPMVSLRESKFASHGHKHSIRIPFHPPNMDISQRIAVEVPVLMCHRCTSAVGSANRPHTLPSMHSNRS